MLSLKIDIRLTISEIIFAHKKKLIAYIDGNYTSSVEITLIVETASAFVWKAYALKFKTCARASLNSIKTWQTFCMGSCIVLKKWKIT